jgi:ATP-dependent protease ClpP protease subunit
MADINTEAKVSYDRLVRNENTLFLYAPIGSMMSYNYTTHEYEKVGISDSDFIQAINDLKAEGATDVHIRLNSNGGSTKHGQAIIASMQMSGMTIHTYNDGTAASMAAAIWACGQQRHMAKNAILMIHHPWDYCEGNAQEMRECAEILDKISEAMILGFADSLQKTPEEVTTMYFSDYKDKYFTYPDVRAQGLITGSPEEEYQSGIAAVTKDTIAAAIRDPFSEYRPKKAAPDTGNTPAPVAQGIIGRINKFFSPAASSAKSITQPNVTDMTKAELKAALTDGTLSATDVQALLAEHTAATPPPPAPAADPNAALIADFKAELNALKGELSNAQAQIATFAAAPGAGRSTPPPPANDLPIEGDEDSPQARLARFNQDIEASLAKGEQVRFVPS